MNTSRWPSTRRSCRLLSYAGESMSSRSEPTSPADRAEPSPSRVQRPFPALAGHRRRHTATPRFAPEHKRSDRQKPSSPPQCPRTRRCLRPTPPPPARACSSWPSPSMWGCPPAPPPLPQYCRGCRCRHHRHRRCCPLRWLSSGHRRRRFRRSSRRSRLLVTPPSAIRMPRCPLKLRSPSQQVQTTPPPRPPQARPLRERSPTQLPERRRAR